MSPEQCRRDAIDRRSDIFSLGIILWELSLGRRLFNNLKGLELAEYIGRTQAPRPSTFKPDYPEELERIVMRALALDPAKRYPTARALEKDLEEFARTRQLSISRAGLAEFMQELFADEIQVEEARVQDYLAHNLATPPPVQSPVQYTQALEALDQGEALRGLLAPFGDDAEPPPWRRALPVIIIASAVLLFVGALFVGGSSEPATVGLRPSSGAEVWDENDPVLDNKPITVSQPREIVVPASGEATPSPEDAVTTNSDPSKKAAKSTAKKNRPKRTKKKVALPADWDPNSPLPPPR